MYKSVDFQKKIEHIERLLHKNEYTDSATRCVIVIEQTLRHVGRQYLEQVDEETKRKFQAAVQKRDRRGEGIESLTMGQLVHVFREARRHDTVHHDRVSRTANVEVHGKGGERNGNRGGRIRFLVDDLDGLVRTDLAIQLVVGDRNGRHDLTEKSIFTHLRPRKIVHRVHGLFDHERITTRQLVEHGLVDHLDFGLAEFSLLRTRRHGAPRVRKKLS